MCERFLTGGFDGWQAIGQNTGEDADHLFVTVIDLFKSAADLLHGRWQDPILEWCAVPQRTGFAGQNRYIVPGIKNRDAAAKDTIMFTNNGTILPNDDPLGIGLDLHWSADSTGKDRVFVVVKTNQTRLRYRGWDTMKAVEPAGIGHKAAAFRFQCLPDRLFRHFRVRMDFGIGYAFIHKPGVEVFQCLEAQARCKTVRAPVLPGSPPDLSPIQQPACRPSAR